MAATPTLLVRAVSQSADPNRTIRVARADLYPKQIWWFLACFLAVLTAFHIGALFVIRRRRQRLARSTSSKREKFGTTGEPTRSSINNQVSLRRVPLAIINAFRIIAFRVTLPTGGGNVINATEVGVTAGYIIVLFTWEFINCMNVKTGTKLDVPYWANRAGNIAASQLPLVVALGGKNNLVSAITGIGYEKLNVLHRAAARVILVLVWIHFQGRIKQGLKGSSALTSTWMQTGVVAVAAHTLLVFISLRPFRTRYYEFFFFSHIVLVLLVLIGNYHHIRGSHGDHFDRFIVPCYVFWGLDRTFRAVRVLWNNRSIHSSQVPIPLEVTAEVLSPTMVRLALVRKMTWRAGQTVLITMPGVSCVPFEAHPFTIATIPQSRSLRDVSSAASLDDDTLEEALSKDGNELVFLIRVKEGFTKRLREAAEKKSSVPFKSIYVDGPYGCPPDFNAFESVMIFAGGSGASYALPILQDIVFNARKGKSGCSNVFFVWVVALQEHISGISGLLREAIEATPDSLSIRIRLHVTQRGYTKGPTDSKNPPSEETFSTTPDTDILIKDSRVRLERGRPDTVALLQEELADAQGTVAVVVAGPMSIAADVRTALSYGNAGPTSVLKGGPDVTLHVETFQGIA